MQQKRLLIALIVMALAMVALVILAGLALSGLLWFADQNASLQSQLNSLLAAA